MAIPRIDELKEPPILGKYYWVHCVKPIPTNRLYWLYDDVIPIIGPSHDDTQIINFPQVHWHVDWRFVGRKSFRAVNSGLGGRYSGTVASTHLYTKPELVRLRFKRPFPEFMRSHTLPSGHIVRVEWMPALEAAYKDQHLVCGKCPHQGIDLSTIPAIDGIKSCPGHGLRWRSQDGSLALDTNVTQRTNEP